MIESLFKELSSLEQVEAIALGGSRAGNEYDDKSDYDIYLYSTSLITESVRTKILSKYCSVMEIGNHYWEYEDNCTLNDGTDIDILYRNLDDFTEEVASVVEKNNAHNGYTTCMWHNLKTCKIVYDKNGCLGALKKRFDVPYPIQLKKNIIERNIKLLHGTLPAYNHQIEKAVRRKDIVSINHRTTAFVESYFDVIYALNELTHPGEKRLIELCKQQCRIIPKDFEYNLNTLFNDLFVKPDKINSDINCIIEELDKLLE
jgi:hypothetical protein